MTQNSDSDIRSRELASKNGGLTYFFKFEDQEVILVPGGGGGGGTPPKYLYGYVPPNGVVIFGLLI